MKKRRLYVSCILMLAAALVTAGMFPQLVLGIQDTYRMRTIQTKSREEMDMINIDIPYEMSVGKRLGSFAKNDGGFLTAGTERTINAESYELTDKILFEYDGLRYLSESILPSLGHLRYGYRIENFKKYVIYDEQPGSGVALIVWYMKLNFDDGRYLECLSDEKTDTVYYLKYSGFEVSDVFFKNIYLEDMVFYVRNYFECDMSYNEKEYLEAEKFGVINIDTQKKSFTIEGSRLEAPLSYGDESLDFVFEIQKESKDLSDISIGIRQIGELISELQ